MPLEDQIVFDVPKKVVKPDDNAKEEKKTRYDLTDIPELPDLPPEVPELKDPEDEKTKNRDNIKFDLEIFEGAGRVPICPWCNMQVVAINKRKVRGTNLVTCRYCDKVLGVN